MGDSSDSIEWFLADYGRLSDAGKVCYETLLDTKYKKLKDYKYTRTNTKVDFYALQEGEVYVRPKGTDPVIVTDINESDGSLGVIYFNGNSDRPKPAYMWATERKLKENKEEETMTNTNKLYQIIGTETYGTHIATNSKGAYVLEMKGSGEVVTKDKKDLEEVVPYTISLKFLFNDGRSTEYAYFSKEGEVSVNDLIIVNGCMAKVTGVNTRSTKATKDLEGSVVVTKKIGE